MEEGTNHDKPGFKKLVENETHSTFVYYWDGRDGPSFSGWWIGPDEVGGRHVFQGLSPRATYLP